MTPQAQDLASGASLTDLLKRLPEFEVISPMSITLRGASFRVLINGKPSGLSPAQLNTINMAEVQSIEVITTPSVRYRASDVGGVVNIKLKRFRPGFNSVLQAAGGTDNCYHLSGSANVGFKKVSLFGSLYGLYEGAKSGYTYQSSNAAGERLERYQLDDRMNNLRLQPKLGIDYTPTSRDAFSAFWTMRFWRHKYTRDAERIYRTQAAQYGGSRSRYNCLENSVNMLYTHSFNDDGLELSVAASGSHEKVQEGLLRRGLELGHGEWRSEDLTPNSFDLSFSSDVSVPLPREFKLDAGLAVDVSGKAENVAYSRSASSGEGWVSLPDEDVKSAALSQVYGAYVDLSWDINEKVALNGGVRYEHFRLRTREARRDTKLARQTNDVFFSGGVSYTPIKPLLFSLSYSGRVDRPTPFDLLSIKTVADFYNEYYVGNPNLTSAYSHGVELNMSQRFERFSFSEDAKWTYVGNAMESYSGRLSDTTWMKSTVNLQQERTLYFGFRGEWEAASWCYVGLSANGRGVKSQSKEGKWLVYDACRYYVRASLDFPINSMWLLDVNGGYRSGSRNAYRHYKGDMGLNVGVYFYPLRTRSLILVLQGLNLLSTSTNYTTYADGITANCDFNWWNRAVYLSVFWRFGKQFSSKIGERFNSGINRVGR